MIEMADIRSSESLPKPEIIERHNEAKKLEAKFALAGMSRTPRSDPQERVVAIAPAQGAKTNNQT